MTDQTPDLAALRALAEAATPGPWRQAPWHMANVMPKAWAEDVQPIEDRGPFMCIATTSGGSSDMAANRREAEALAAFVAASDPSTVLWLIREVEQLQHEVSEAQADLDNEREYRDLDDQAAEMRADVIREEWRIARARANEAEATIERVRSAIAEARETGKYLPGLLADALDGIPDPRCTSDITLRAGDHDDW